MTVLLAFSAFLLGCTYISRELRRAPHGRETARGFEFGVTPALNWKDAPQARGKHTSRCTVVRSSSREYTVFERHEILAATASAFKKHDSKWFKRLQQGIYQCSEKEAANYGISRHRHWQVRLTPGEAEGVADRLAQIAMLVGYKTMFGQFEIHLLASSWETLSKALRSSAAKSSKIIPFEREAGGSNASSESVSGLRGKPQAVKGNHLRVIQGESPWISVRDRVIPIC